MNVNCTRHLLQQFNEVKPLKKIYTLYRFFLEPGQLESPRYNNRPFSLSLTNTSTLNGTTESPTLDQLQKDIAKLKSTMNDMKSKFTDQIQDLMNELDEEKKARATLQIEIERLQKLIQKSSRANS